MPERYQYPARAEPVPPIPKGAEENAWHRAASEPVRQIPFSLAAIAPAVFLVVGAIVPFETDEFAAIRQPSEPVLVVAPIVGEGIVVTDPTTPAELLPLDWYLQPNEPVREIPRPVDEGGMVVGPDPEPFAQDILSRWWRPASEPIFPVPPTVPEGIYARAPPDPEQFAPSFAWWREASEPVRTQPHVTREGAAFGPDPEDLPDQDVLSRWWRPASEPVRELPRAIDEGRVDRNLEPISKLDLDWHRRASEPVREIPRPLDEGSFVWQIADPESLIPSFGWWRAPSEPADAVPRPVAEGGTPLQVEILPSEVVPDFGWFREANRPPDPMRRAVDVGAFVANIDPISKLDLDWYRQPVEVPDAVPSPVELGRLARNLDPISKLDLDWFRQPVEVADTAPEPTERDRFAHNVDPISKLDHDWWRPASEPVREVPRAVDEGTSVWPIVDPESFAPSFAWWRQPVQVPATEPPREPGLFAANIDPISKLDLDWLRRPSEPVRVQPRPVDEGALVSGLPDSALRNHHFPEWGLGTNEPVRVPRRIIDEGGLSFIRDIPAVVPDIGWLVAPSEPVRLPPSVIFDLLLVAFDVDTLAPSFAWWRPASELARSLPRTPFDLAPLILEIVPPPPSFAWWVAASEPVRTKAPVEPGLIARNLLPILVSGLEWARLPEIPVLPTHNAAALFLRPVPVLGLPEIFAIPAPPWPRIVATRFRTADPFVEPIRICFPENWPYDSQVMSRETGRVIADEPEPSSGGAPDPESDPDDGHAHRHEWNL